MEAVFWMHYTVAKFYQICLFSHSTEPIFQPIQPIWSFHWGGETFIYLCFIPENITSFVPKFVTNAMMWDSGQGRNNLQNTRKTEEWMIGSDYDYGKGHWVWVVTYVCQSLAGEFEAFPSSLFNRLTFFSSRQSFRACRVKQQMLHFPLIADSVNWVSGMLIINFITINLLQLCNCKTANRIKSSLGTIAQHQFVTTFHSWMETHLYSSLR